MGKTLLVLGGSSDMALEYIRKYQDRYDTIVAQYFSHKEALEELYGILGDKLIIHQVDLSDDDSVQKFIDFINESDIKPDYMLHCPASRTTLARINDFDANVLQREMQLEVFSVLEIIKSIIGHMEDQSFGRICFIISSVTESAIGSEIPYMVTKYALLGTMKALAVELSGKKITVNAVSPSMTQTKFIDETSPFVLKKNISMNPLKRLANPSDICDAIALFLSDDNEYITGQNLLIAGGSIV